MPFLESNILEDDGGLEMNIPNLINQIHKLKPESILYCFPATDNIAQELADEFPFIKIIQELGCWTPPGTRTSISIALSQKFDIVVVPYKVMKDMLTAGITCTKNGGYLFSDVTFEIRNTGLKRGIEKDGVYRYLKK